MRLVGISFHAAILDLGCRLCSGQACSYGFKKRQLHGRLTLTVDKKVYCGVGEDSVLVWWIPVIEENQVASSSLLVSRLSGDRVGERRRSM